MWLSGSPTLLALMAFSTRSSLQVATKASGLKSVRKHFPNEAACWTEGGYGSEGPLRPCRAPGRLTLRRDFWMPVSYSCAAASTHCWTASPNMLCSLISLRYSSAF